ncbi:pentapeptide repeat-containing protein [Nocardia heshunensis]
MTAKRRILLFSVLAASIALVGIVYLVPIWFTRDGKPEEALRNHLTAALGVATPIAVCLVGYAKYRLDRSKQRADSFQTAMDRLLGSDADTRADAVRALERMMTYSPDYRARILESYADLLRTRAGATPPTGPRTALPSDVLAVLTALRRRHPTAADSPLNLTGVRLPRAPLHDIDLSGAQLADADLRSANLHHTILTNANLDHANLTSANLTGASLHGAQLTSAKLVEATLTACDLTGTTVDDAALAGADLTAADLRGVDLRRSSGLTVDQIATAKTDSSTLSPARTH